MGQSVRGRSDSPHTSFAASTQKAADLLSEWGPRSGGKRSVFLRLHQGDSAIVLRSGHLFRLIVHLRDQIPYPLRLLE